MNRIGLLTAVLAATAAMSTATAQVDQDTTAPATPAGLTLLLEQRFVGSRPDSVRLGLRTDGLYVMSIAPRPHRVTAFADTRRREPGLVVPLGTPSATGRSYEVHVPYDDQYWIRVEPASTAETILRLFSDEAGARQHAAVRASRHARSWGIGLGLAAGVHSGYWIFTGEAGSPPAGTDYEGQLVFGNIGRLSGLLGFGYQDRGGAGYGLTYVFAEPRFRLFAPALFARRRSDLGLLFRLANGARSNGPGADPSWKAFGAFLNQHLDHNPGSRGWGLTLSYMHVMVGNIARTDNQTSERVTLGMTWLP